MIGRRHRAAARQRLLPRQARPAGGTQGRADPLPHPAFDAVLRAHRCHRRSLRPGRYGPAASRLLPARIGRRRGRNLGGTGEKPPVNGTVELGGPAGIRLDDLVRDFLGAADDPRQVVTDMHAPYYGIAVVPYGLRGLARLPGLGASLGAAAGAICAGPLADRFGRKWLLIVDAGIYAIFCVRFVPMLAPRLLACTDPVVAGSSKPG